MNAGTPATPKPTKGRPKKSTKPPTWEHPERSGISIAEVPNRTAGRVFGTSFRVIIPAAVTGVTGRREFSNHKTKEAAFRHAEDRFLALRRHGQSFTELPVWAQQDALRAWQMLREAKLDDPKTGGGFIHAIEAAIRVLRPAGGERTLGAVIEELIAHKRLQLSQGNLRAATVEDFVSRTAAAREALGEGRPIATVTRDDIAGWLRKLATEGRDGHPLSPTSVLNYRKHLREVFIYATKRRYTPTNPVAELTRAELETFGGTKSAVAEVHVLLPEEAARLLQAAADNPGLSILPALVLRLFCGLRTAEVVRLDWQDVRWQDAKPLVRLDGATTKTRNRRNVDIPSSALEWLALCPVKAGPVAAGKDDRKLCKAFRQLRKLANLTEADDPRDWDNITRHSFGSYHLALTESADKTRMQLGHSNDVMLFEHYRGLVTKADAERFFAIRPGDSQAAPIPFAPVAAAG